MSDPAASRPTKRVKVEENVAYTRSDVWFDDGSIVLEAGDVLFRVHKSILIDRCHLVHLSDDARELKHVLKALYGEASYFKSEIPMDVVSISAFVNLGTKYNIPLLRDEALARISYDCPSSLQAHRGRQGCRLAYRPFLEIDLINLARRLKLSSSLPLLFYYTAQNSARQIMTYAHHANGSITALALEDQIRCLEGRERVLEHQVKHQLSSLDTKGDDCTADHRCTLIRDTLMKRSRDGVLKATSLNEKWAEFLKGAKLCKSCENAALSRREQYQGDFWEKLPGFYGLGSWAELKAGVEA